ncbi:MAG: LLM class flavin-dependent oxidoreductase [Chloroflexota bacterium]
MVQLSFGVSGGKPLHEYVALAQLAESYEFHTFSVFDDLMFKPAWPILFMIAQHTQRIRLGPSVCNPYLIHPAILAENAALLDELSGGRAYLGLGRGAFLDFVGVPTPKPITAVREAIDLCRRLWKGDASSFDGQMFQATSAAKLQWQPIRPELPIMVGTWGPQMCRMAGATADEVKAGSMWSERYGNYMWQHIEAGARDNQRDPNRVGLVFGPLTSVADDRDQAKHHAKQTLAFYLPFLAPMPEFLGMEAEAIDRVRMATDRGDIDAAVSLISDDILGQFALYGTPQDLIEQIEHMTATTKVTRIEFGMPHSPGGSIEAIHLLGRYVLPHFTRQA